MGISSSSLLIHKDPPMALTLSDIAGLPMTSLWINPVLHPQCFVTHWTQAITPSSLTCFLLLASRRPYSLGFPPCSLAALLFFFFN